MDIGIEIEMPNALIVQFPQYHIPYSVSQKVAPSPEIIPRK